jgi:hypothetical protein
MSESQAHEFYKDPEHLATAGPGERRQRPMKSAMVPVRFSPEMISAVKRLASQDGVTVSTWIRQLVGREIQRRQPPSTAAALGALPPIQLSYSPRVQPTSETVSPVQPELRAVG